MTNLDKEINSDVNTINACAKNCDVGQINTSIKTITNLIGENPRYLSKQFVNALNTLLSYINSATSSDLTADYKNSNHSTLVKDASNLRKAFSSMEKHKQSN